MLTAILFILLYLMNRSKHQQIAKTVTLILNLLAFCRYACNIVDVPFNIYKGGICNTVRRNFNAQNSNNRKQLSKTAFGCRAVCDRKRADVERTEIFNYHLQTANRWRQTA